MTDATFFMQGIKNSKDPFPFFILRLKEKKQVSIMDERKVC